MCFLLLVYSISLDNYLIQLHPYWLLCISIIAFKDMTCSDEFYRHWIPQYYSRCEMPQIKAESELYSSGFLNRLGFFCIFVCILILHIYVCISIVHTIFKSIYLFWIFIIFFINFSLNSNCCHWWVPSWVSFSSIKGRPRGIAVLSLCYCTVKISIKLLINSMKISVAWTIFLSPFLSNASL